MTGVEPAAQPRAAVTPAAGPLVTVGHGTASAEELGNRLRDAGVKSLVDIRIGPAAGATRTSTARRWRTGCRRTTDGAVTAGWSPTSLFSRAACRSST